MYDIENPMTIGAECAADQDSCECPFCGRRWAFNVVQRQPEWYCADADISIDSYTNPVGDWCPACEDAYNEEQELKKKRREYQRRYRATHGDQERAYHRRYYAEHREAYVVYQRRYRATPQGYAKCVESNRRYRANHPDISWNNYAKLKADPVKYAEYLEYQRQYRAKRKEAKANG